MKNYKIPLLLLVMIFLQVSIYGQEDTIYTKTSASGHVIKLSFEKGKAHNHPLMAVWLEDADSNYLETLYVAESIGTGIFRHGSQKNGKWGPGEVRRPAALPYWSHKRGVKYADGLYVPTPDKPVADAITGPTPGQDFVLISRTAEIIPTRFRVLFEINQSWDWNEYWHNSKYPDDKDYKTSSQPSIIYEALLDLNKAGEKVKMKMIGHGHYAGKNGKLYTDLSTLTTAKKIAGDITVELEK